MQDAIAFLKRWAPTGYWVLSAIDPNRKGKIETKTFGAEKESEALAWLQFWNGKRNLYFSVNQTRHEMTSKAEKTDIVSFVALHVDIDPDKAVDAHNAEAWDAEQQRLLAKLQAYSPAPTIILFSGGGYQGFWLLREPVEVENVEDVARLESYNKQLEVTLGGDHCFNIDRIMRVPYTLNLPDKKKREKGRIETLAGVVSDDPERLFSINDFQAYVAPAPKGKGTDFQPRVKFDPPEWCQRLIALGPDKEGPRSYDGDRSKAVWAVCCALVRSGWSHDDIVEAILDPANVLSEHVRAQPKPGPYAHRQASKARDKVGSEFTSVHVKHKDGTETEKIVVNQDNLRLAIAKLDISLSHDLFMARDMIEGPSGLPLRGYDDYEENLLCSLLDQQFGLRPSREYLRMFVTVTARENSYHPVCDYLAGLVWDGVPRIDTWLVTYAGATDSAYIRAVSALILMAACRRVRQPGCKFDEIVVFISTQGLDKSSALMALATRNEWFTDSLPLDAEGREVIEVLEGKWIVEASELKGLRNIEHLKAMLSRQIDRGRKAYGHFVSEAPRQCVFFGTTNNDAFLRDTTGNRRFWPVKIIQLDVAGILRDRDLLWAEAAMREAAGESIRLSPDLYAEAALEQARRQIDDPWMPIFEQALGKIARGKTLCADAWAILDIPKGQRNQEHSARLGECMRNLGWERVKLSHSGRSQWHYAVGERGLVENPLPYISITRDYNGVLLVELSSDEPVQETLLN